MKVTLLGTFPTLRKSVSAFKLVAGDRPANFTFIDKKSTVLKKIENTAEAPSFFFDGDGQGKPYSAFDRRNTWCYDRIVHDDGKGPMTQAELFNAGHWEYPGFPFDGVQPREEGSSEDEAVALKPEPPKTSKPVGKLSNLLYLGFSETDSGSGW